jgi:hypothetical protein
MTIRPHDRTDLYLAPVALELDRRLAAMSGRSREELDVEVAIATDRQPWDADSRRTLLLEALVHLVPLRGWQVSWAERGLRLSHGEHELVLGVPDSVREYVRR